MKKFLLFTFLITHLAAGDLFLYDDRFRPAFVLYQTAGSSFTETDTTEIAKADSVQFVNYPAKPMLFSLLVPGLGQYKNGDPIWKSAIFAGIEAASILGWAQWNKQAEDIRKQYELFGDNHWSLKGWVENTHLNPVINPTEYPDFKIDGTHKLDLHLSGSLAELFGEFISSDSLTVHPEWIYTDEVTILQDQHFYENIGKYDQFVGGWSDAASDWYWEEKDVGDSIEIVIKTPKKQNFLDQRYTANQWLSFAKYSVTALMFNHVISGLDAVWSPQRKTLREKDETETEVSLIFNPYNTSGIGGISLSLYF